MSPAIVHCAGCFGSGRCGCVQDNPLTLTEYGSMPERILLNHWFTSIFPPGFATVVSWLALYQYPPTWSSVFTQSVVTLSIGVFVALLVRVFTVAVLDKYLPLRHKYEIKHLPPEPKMLPVVEKEKKKPTTRRRKPPNVK